MLIFNGRLLIKTCEATAVDRWSVSAKFTDNTGQFTAYNALVGNRVYARGTNENGDSALCAYKIVEITQRGTTANTLMCSLQFDETYTGVAEVYTPDLEEDAVICEASSEAGFAMVPGDVTGLPQNVLDYMANIALWQRDERFGTKVEAMIAEAADSALKSGVIDGDLEVTGKVSVGNGYRVLNATSQEVGTWKADELRTVITGDQPVMNLSMSASTKAAPTVSVVSDGDIDATTVLNATGEASRKTTVTGLTSAEDEEELVSRGDVAWSVKANGATANADITVTGATTAGVNITAKVTDESGEAVITLDSTRTRATGQLSAAGIVSDGAIAAQRFVRTADGSQVDPENNELITAEYMKAYVLANAGGGASSEVTDELQTLLAGKANVGDVYTKLETDALLSGLTLASLSGDTDHRTVTDAQIASWDAKSEVSELNYVPENIANKGVPGGYAALDNDGYVMTTQMNEEYINGLIDARAGSGGAFGGTISANNVVETTDKKFVSSAQINAWDDKQNKLGYTPENVANKGLPNGYASLDENGVVYESQVNVSKVEEIAGNLIDTLTTDNIPDTATHRYVTDEQIASWTAKGDASNAEVITNKGVPNGYAALDENGKVPESQLTALPVVTLSMDGSYSLDGVTSQTKLAFTGSQNGETVEDVTMYMVEDGTAYQVGELSVYSKLGVPWSLLTRIPECITKFTANGKITTDMIADMAGLEPGTYTQVTINGSGLVTAGSNPEVLDITGTTAPTFKLGVGHEDDKYITLTVATNMKQNPFIRFNLEEHRWEYSNNGYDVYAFGSSEPLVKETLDFGYVNDPNIELAIPCRSVADETMFTIDFNGDAFADIANIQLDQM